MLTGGLLNDPTTLDWENYGNERNLVVDETFPGGAALNVKQAQAGEVFTGGLNVPLVAAVDAGERVTVGFYARTLASGAEGGAGKLGVRFQLNQEPYPGFGDAVLDIGTEWKWYEVTAEANQAMRRNGIVALQTGLAAQTLQIGQAIVVSGTRSINE